MHWKIGSRKLLLSRKKNLGQSRRQCVRKRLRLQRSKRLWRYRWKRLLQRNLRKSLRWKNLQRKCLKRFWKMSISLQEKANWFMKLQHHQNLTIRKNWQNYNHDSYAYNMNFNTIWIRFRILIMSIVTGIRNILLINPIYYGLWISLYISINGQRN